MKSVLLTRLAQTLLLVAPVAADAGYIGRLLQADAVNATVVSSTEDAVASDELPCTVCPAPGLMRRPDRDIITQYGPFLPADLVNLLTDQGAATCTEIDAVISSIFTVGHPGCQGARFSFSGNCGCPPLQDYCELCPNEELSDPDLFITRSMWAQYGVQDFLAPTTCGDFQQFLEQVPKGSSDCTGLQGFNFFCGCNKGKSSILLGTGETAERRANALLWIPRVMGVLSITASLCIIQHLWRHRSSQASSTSTAGGGVRQSARAGITTGPLQLKVQHELLLALCIFDILSSTAWAFGSFPIPKEAGVTGAHGNEASCTAQGFFVQLGQTGAIYNMALSILYLLTVRYGWRETRLRSIAKYLHLSALAGVVMAFGGLPFYGHTVWGCYIRAPPFATTYLPLVMFSILPICIVTIVATVNMVLVFVHVREVDEAASRWRFANTQGREGLGDAVFWQAMVYLAGFYFVWPVFMIYNTFIVDMPYGVYVLVVLLTPTQGLWNALAYFRPIIIAERLKRNSNATENSNSNANGSSSKTRHSMENNQPQMASMGTNTTEEPSVPTAI